MAYHQVSDGEKGHKMSMIIKNYLRISFRQLTKAVAPDWSWSNLSPF